MKVTVIQSCLVPPAELTFNGTMPLTESDQTTTLTHVPTIYFYRPSHNWLTPTHTIYTTLQTSLSKVLVHFYPKASRLRWLDGARLELHCNNKGVQLVEPCSDAVLNDLGDFTPSPEFHHLITHIDYASPIEEIPLLTLQLTMFKCGGVTLSCSISHAVADGLSALHFLSEWARLTLGEPLDSPPVHNRRLLRAGEPQPRFKHTQFDPPPLLLGQSDTEKERKKETTIAAPTLKNKANRGRPVSSTSRPYTRYEAIAGHIWRCACKARRHAHEQPTRLGICVDVRRRMQPPLPEKFFGNAIIDVVAKRWSGEVTQNQLSYACSLIRAAIDSVTSEYVNSDIDYLKNLKDFTKLQDIHALKSNEVPFYGNLNMGVINCWILGGGENFSWLPAHMTAMEIRSSCRDTTKTAV